MKANKQFTIRLANGREETFDNASAMVEWMDRQRGLDYRVSRSRSTPRIRCQPRRTQANTNEAPLARYANRHSGEATKASFGARPSCLRTSRQPVLLEMHWRKNTARSSIGRTPVRAPTDRLVGWKDEFDSHTGH